MDKLKVAVIGIGVMGRNHARVYSEMEDVSLVAVCDTNLAEAKKLAAKYSAKAYSDYNEMLKKEKLDAVTIAVPTIMHAEVAVKVIGHGINVLVEKPITSTVEEAKKLIALAKQKNVKLFVGHIERFNPVVTELKKRIAGHDLGRIYTITSHRLSPFPMRILDVGVTIDLAVHEIDIVAYLTESKIKRIFAETERKIHSKSEDLLVGLMRFENNILGVINCNWLTPRKVREIQITGEKGMFVGNYLAQELYFYENDFASQKLDYSAGPFTVIEGNMTKIRINTQEPLKLEVRSFVDCIRQDSKPAVTGEDGLHAIEVASKLLESAKTGKSILISHDA